jgi:RNA polymerase I-specific transcription initiation factor RRN7
MLQRLPAYHQTQLRPKIHLTEGKLLHAVTSLVLLYNKDFGLEMPALNLPPHLFRLVEELALPLEVYPAVRRLAAFMKFNFRYPDISKNRISIIDFPEAQLVACITLAIKLFYGFDGTARIPADETSPGLAMIDWKQWEEIMKDSAPLEYQEAMQMTDREVIDLPDVKIDDYLDFFQEHFTIHDPQDRDKDADFRKMMLGLFPVGQRSTQIKDTNIPSTTRKQDNIQVMQQTLKPNQVISRTDEMDLGEKLVRPGEKYEVHRNVYQLTGHAETFYKAMAHISGLPLKSVVRAVVHTENILMRLKKGKHPRGRGGQRYFKSKERLDNEDLASEIVGSDVSMEK